ncbi:potassium transporter Kef [Natrarchaeobius halalkaliphilus]|uniref:Potassium transporter Kef n=1 Tax=Natrarchaeobius halalkaliphilus TaxID=1679091 RepID=A0A3N6LPF6_9EURY|nr:cation:proton antiporter [Natrarchaeobius halalkaliphilus]RQG90017.1 potassium transporter Kef [Natrarchaeobius halalkaliphilus]
MPLEEIAVSADFALLLASAAILGYVARLTKQPTIVAYVLTGVVIGPIGLGLITGESGLIEVIAELGLGFLLFLLGIKMSFEDIKEIMRPVGKIAVGQAILQAVASTTLALLLGFTLYQSLILALATTFGATPIIVKVLSDKDELKSLYGRVDIGVLIFQDIYLVFALAILAVGTVDSAEQIAFSISRVIVLMIVMGVGAYLASKYVLPTLLRASATNKSALFTVGIAWAFVFIYAAEVLDLSVELGAFIAGLALANLPYSTELKEQMRPVTDLFIAVFFASIALQMERGQLLVYWQEAVIASFALLTINFFIVFGLFYSQKFDMETSFLGTISMLQVSEFSIVLGALAVNEGFVAEAILGFLSLMALITMPISTYYVIYNREIYERVRPYLERFEHDDPIEFDPLTYENHAVIVGYDGVTGRLTETLENRFEDVVFVEDQRERIETLRRKDLEFIFGDSRHGEIRKDANVREAALVLSTLDRTDINRRLIEDAGNADVIVLANDEADANELEQTGASHVIREQQLLEDAVSTILAGVDDEGTIGEKNDVIRWKNEAGTRSREGDFDV